MIIDHTGVAVSDIAKSRTFYDAALAPLGAKVTMEVNVPGYTGLGYGKGKPDFWLGAHGGPATTPIHIAFSAASRAEVDAFYAAAMAAGGKDNGPPGPRPQYHPGYYAAFVFDPDGHNIEAVCHKPE